MDLQEENDFNPEEEIDIGSKNKKETSQKMLDEKLKDSEQPAQGNYSKDGEVTFVEKISRDTSSIIDKYLGFIKAYFDIETPDVQNKLIGALIPMNNSFYSTVEEKPELYGPFWIYTTIIFLITVVGNISGYLSLEDKNKFTCNYNFLPIAALFMYGIGFGVPLILFFVTKIICKIDIGFIINICLYGYSFTSLIPIMLLCIIPIGWVETILIGIFIVYSSIFLFYNMWKFMSEKAEKAKYVILVILGGMQVLLFFGLKFYFLSAASVSASRN